MNPIHCATFIFRAGQFDDEFHQLDQAIAEAARQTQGYLGEQVWQSPDQQLIATHYYWSDPAGLQQLMQNPNHQQAKARQGEWLDGYQVILSQVLHYYGDGQLPPPPFIAA